MEFIATAMEVTATSAAEKTAQFADLWTQSVRPSFRRERFQASNDHLFGTAFPCTEQLSRLSSDELLFAFTNPTAFTNLTLSQKPVSIQATHSELICPVVGGDTDWAYDIALSRLELFADYCQAYLV